MKREDAAFIRYLEEHGYDVRELGLTPSAESEAEEERARMTDSESGEIQELKKSRSDEGATASPRTRATTTASRRTLRRSRLEGVVLLSQLCSALLPTWSSFSTVTIPLMPLHFAMIIMTFYPHLSLV